MIGSLLVAVSTAAASAMPEYVPELSQAVALTQRSLASYSSSCVDFDARKCSKKF